MTFWWWFPLVAAGSALLTGAIRRYSLEHGVLDIPIGRSLHTQPTPRGGGVAIFVAFLLVVAVLVAMGIVELHVAGALLGPCALVVLVGFLDDHRPIATSWRLLAHFAAAMWALTYLGGLPPVQVVGTVIDLGWLGHGLAVVYLVWLLNLYNFMDGIDGIAGLEAVTVCCGAATLILQYSTEGQDWLAPVLLAMSALGFLVWNWPPARIFMGDAGSGFLGLAIGILSIKAAWLAPELLWGWIILLGVFVVDATLTLLRRLHRGEQPHKAHRDHAYQHAALQFRGHCSVTITVGAVNLCWLLPVAWLVAKGWIDGFLGLLVAYAPVVCLATKFKAGVPLAEQRARPV